MNDEGNENQFSKLTSKIDLQNNCPCVSNDIRIMVGYTITSCVKV